MDQRSSSWPKVVPTQIETLVDNVSDVAMGKDASAAPPLSPSDVNVKLSLTAAPEPCSIRSRLTLPPTLTLPPITCDVSIATTTATTAAADRERRGRAKSLSDSMPRAIHHALDQIRRHSVGTTQPRPSEISLAREHGESFRDVFGVLGVPMVLAFIFSAGAMFNQAYIQIYPSEFANLLMNTSHYDNGEFWLMDKTSSATVAIATTMLVFFGCCYLVLVLYMIFFRHLAIEKKPNTTLQAAAAKRKRAESTVTNSIASRESTATEVEEEITVAEIAKGVLLTNWEFLRDAFFSVVPCLKSRNQQQQSSVTADAEATQRKNMAMARKKMQRARAIYF